MSVNFKQYQDWLGHEEPVREQCAIADFRIMLRNERLRSERNGAVFTYIKVYFKSDTSNAGEGRPSAFVKYVVQQVQQSTVLNDVRFFVDEGQMGFLLLDTPPEEAKLFVEHLIQRGENQQENAYDLSLMDQFIRVELNAYPISKVMDHCCLFAKPVIINNLNWNRKGQLASSRIMPQQRLVLDWQSESFRENTETLNNAIVKDGSQTVHQWRYKYIKRFFDVIGASVFIVSLALPMLIVAAIIKATSKGPVLFRQMRVGQLGKKFEFLKFRSMAADSDTKAHEDYVKKLIQGELEEINNGSEENPVFKMVDDPRITAFGKIMRKTSIDEIPQFFNVLKGDMSLVGPRPPIPYEVLEYKDWHLRRISDVKPGITGLWQVYGRNSTTFDEMVRFDIDYVDQWSLKRDFKILLLTVRSVLDVTGN